MSTPRKKRNEVNSESIPSRQVPWQDGQAKSYNAEFSIAGNSPSEPSRRFVPPQSNNTNSSSQDTDSLNTTMVYYEKSTGECQTKTTSIQTSPSDPEFTGTTTATQTTNKDFTGRRNYQTMPPHTQTTNKKTSQVGGTQTMPPPPPKKTTSTGETQTSPPTGETQTSPPTGNSHWQVGQGQSDLQSRQRRSTDQYYIK